MPEINYYKILCIEVTGFNYGQKMLVTRSDYDFTWLGGMNSQLNIENGICYWAASFVQASATSTKITTNNDGDDHPVRRYQNVGSSQAVGYKNLDIAKIYGVL